MPCCTLWPRLVKEDPAAYGGLYHVEYSSSQQRPVISGFAPVGYNQPRSHAVSTATSASPADQRPPGRIFLVNWRSGAVKASATSPFGLLIKAFSVSR